MDCVECQTCKVHSKLQMLGIGTALKILLPASTAPKSLERNEIIALINTFHKFSETIRIVELMRARRDALMATREAISASKKPELPSASEFAAVFPWDMLYFLALLAFGVLVGRAIGPSE